MSSSWSRYYDKSGEDARPTLRLALDLFERDGTGPGFAVDLGCGTGRDTFELLRRGWRVLAIDAEAEAIERLRRAAPATDLLATEVVGFEDATWLPAELVNSSYALPFCEPDVFDALWPRIVDSLPRGSRFSGQLFGDRDGWAGGEGMTFVTRAEAERLLRGFELERFEEIEEDGRTAVGDEKHWHLFHVVARKR